MATYLPNLTDRLQPIDLFTPSWKYFEASLGKLNAMQQRAMENLSNYYYYVAKADLTHDGNKQLRNDFLKVYEDNIKNVAKLDLTKTENINYARSLFTPLTEDKNFVYDLYFTQTEKDELAKAMISKEDYNDTSVRAIKMRIFEFSKANREELSSISPFKYVPNVNEAKLALEYLQKIDPKVKRVEKTQDGKYIVTKENGESSVYPIGHIIATLYNSDARIREKYKQEAYLIRMGYLYNDGAIKGAEKYIETINSTMAYLKASKNVLNTLIEKQSKLQGKVQEELLVTLNNAKDLGDLTQDVAVKKKMYDKLIDLYNRFLILKNNLSSSLEQINEINSYEQIMKTQNILESDAFDGLWASKRITENALDLSLAYSMATRKEEIKADEIYLKNIDASIEKMKLDAKRMEDLEKKLKNFYFSQYYMEVKDKKNSLKYKYDNDPNVRRVLSESGIYNDGEVHVITVDQENRLSIADYSRDYITRATAIKNASVIKDIQPTPPVSGERASYQYVPYDIIKRGDKYHVQLIEIVNPRAQDVLSPQGASYYASNKISPEYLTLELSLDEYIGFINQKKAIVSLTQFQ